MRAAVLGALLLAACGDDDAAPDAARVPDAGVAADAWAGGDGFELVGHVDLDDDAFLNQGLTIAGDHAYTGHSFSGGVTVTDISDPTAPVVVERFQPSAEIVELIAIADLQRLYAICRGCAPEIGLAVFDLADPTAPTLIDVFEMPGGRLPHELFVWRDPADPDRVLAFVTDVRTTDPRALTVIDVSDPSNMVERHRSAGPASHGVSVSRDGTRLYVSQLQDGVEIFDATQVLGAGASPAVPSLTGAANRFRSCTSPGCITHSTVEVPNRDLAVVTYESDRCPKGWLDVIDVSEPAAITKVGEYRHPKYELCLQGTSEPYLGLFGYGPHNPTVTEHLALVSWYRAGLIAIDLTDPAAPTPLFAYAPDVPDPLSEGRWGKLASVSYPIVRDGLIYVLDGRNGLDILRYHGPYEDELTADPFLEGNSNL